MIEEDRKKLIETFVIKGPVIFGVPGIRNLDQRRINQLPDEEFAQLYLGLMEEYKNDGFWADGRLPKCSECGMEIAGPTELRRFYGRSLHPECFCKVYSRERKDNKGIERKYLERVTKLKLDELAE